jgi:hypothetical protein
MQLRTKFYGMTDTVQLDLNDIASGKVELASFKAKIDSMDFSTYQGKRVQLSGCAPTWAHLLVASKLFPLVSGLDFLLDDGKDGQAIPVLK